MGLGDFIDKAKDVVADNEEAVEDGIDQVADVVDDKTGGKYSDQVDQGAEAAKDFVDDLGDNE